MATFWGVAPHVVYYDWTIVDFMDWEEWMWLAIEYDKPPDPDLDYMPKGGKPYKGPKQYRKRK